MEYFLGVEGPRLYDNFLSAAEEKELLAAIDASKWNTTLKRRTQHYGYLYNYTSKDVAKDTSVQPIPGWCDAIIGRLLERKILAQEPNQLIINEYQPGQGIYPHIDSVEAFEDGIVSISLGSNIVMDFSSDTQNLKMSGTLPRLSALSLHGPARYEWSHGIAPRKKDNGVLRGRRVSLTFRRVKL